MKVALANEIVLAHFNPNSKLRTETDGRVVAVGAILMQDSPEDYQVVPYSSRRLTKAQRNYTISEIELLAIVFALEKFDGYVSHVKFEVIADHSALVGLFRLPNPKGRIARWILALRPYNMKITYRTGKKNETADLLSRQSEEVELTNNYINFSRNGE